VTIDAASVVYTDEVGNRFRLPKGRADYRLEGPLGFERTVREVCTEPTPRGMFERVGFRAIRSDSPLSGHACRQRCKHFGAARSWGLT
jgi:hypothetical protein